MRVSVSVFMEPSDPIEVVVIRVTVAAPPEAEGAVTIETVRPTATSEADTLAVSGNVCSRPSAPTTTMLFPASYRTTRPWMGLLL